MEDSGTAQDHADRAFAQDQGGDLAAAESSYRAALALAPYSATLHLNLGALLAQQQRHGEAEACYACALALEPACSAVWSNLGALHLGLKNDDTADACLRQAIALEPDNARARFNLAYLQLRHGNYEEGWALFEARDWYHALAQHFTFARWQGQALEGRSLLVTFEAGHGDVIQFCRYIPLLKARGARHITLLCHAALTRLLRGLEGLDAVLGLDEPVPQQGFDYWMPLLSAPYHLATRAHSVPAQLPYLRASCVHLAHTAQGRHPTDPLRVGLVWKGNPLFENDAQRSLPHLQTLSPLWQVPGIAFVSLQKGAGEDQIAACTAQQPLLHAGADMQDFADAAALISGLDLVISVDTAMAHLAGALGKPCWLLLPWHMTDWRWGDTGTACVWYPQVMRLFRQGSDASWGPVVADLVLALRERIVPPHGSAR